MGVIDRVLSVVKGKGAGAQQGNWSQYGRDGGEELVGARAGVCPVARCSGVLGKVSTYYSEHISI